VSRAAVVAGATGLVGGLCLKRLLADETYGRVIALVRRPLSFSHPRLERRLTDFDAMSGLPEDVEGADVICCLGTTIRAAGSEAAFRRVDFEYVLSLARFSSRSGAAQFAFLSSMGADRRSPVLYTRVKGEVEEAVRGVKLPAVQVFRPSFLLGERVESRPAERVAIGVFRSVSFALRGPFRKYRPIAAATVAEAIVRVVKDAPPGVNIYESDAIERIAR
jgi:uncharacterized protein YbjT (DUF2867 family)